jgi:hypothetical protein
MAINMILQGKGGVGKTLVASLLTQWLIGKGREVYCADTDPVNDTFSRYTAFPVETIDIMDSSNNIDTRQFDGLIEKLLQIDTDAVIDNGASTFVPLSAYMAESETIPLLEEAGKEVILHTVLTGGQGLRDTLVGLDALLVTQPAKVVVWENEYFGVITKNGKTFLESDLYNKNKDRILGVVKLEKRTAHTFGKDMELLASNNLTFEQAKTSSLFCIPSLSRVRNVQKAIFQQLDALPL